MSENKERKMTMTVRLSEHDFARIRRACHRDELRPALFAYETIMAGVDQLIKKQEANGYQCMKPL